MNLDTVILNSLKKTPMENAMGGVMRDLGQNYTIQAVPQNVQNPTQIQGKAVAVMNVNPTVRPSINNNSIRMEAHQGSKNPFNTNGKSISPLLRRAF